MPSLEQIALVEKVFATINNMNQTMKNLTEQIETLQADKSYLLIKYEEIMHRMLAVHNHDMSIDDAYDLSVEVIFDYKLDSKLPRRHADI